MLEPPAARSRPSKNLADKIDPPRHVYVVDDDAEVRRSLHFALGTSNITAWPFATPEDFIDQLSTLRPAPVLLDFRMPTLDGLQVLDIMRAREIHWPAIMMSAHGDIPIAVRAIKLGAVDFIEKPFLLDDLEEILIRSFYGLSAIVEKFEAKAAAQAVLELLTSREAEVLNLLTRGMSNRSVAELLKLSNRTIDAHRANIMAKLKVKSLAEVMWLRFEAGEQ